MAGQQPTPSTGRWRERVGSRLSEQLAAAGLGRFGPAEQAEFGHWQERTADSLVATVATHSSLLLMEEAERDRLLAAIRGYLASQPETSAGAFRLPLVTCAMRTVRAG